VLITFFASLYPAISASKLNPIKGLKYDWYIFKVKKYSKEIHWC
jgi:hypothetical protein